jgi:hypothetical protein
VGASTSLPGASTPAPGAYFALGSVVHFFPHPLCPDKDPVPAGSLSWDLLLPHSLAEHEELFRHRLLPQNRRHAPLDDMLPRW